MTTVRWLTRATVASAAAILLLIPGGRALAGQASVPGWRLVHPSSAVETSVLATGRHEAWAFGLTGPPGGPWQKGTPSAAHWITGRWRATPLPLAVRNAIFSVSASSGHDVWAVADYGGYILHWNGTHWSVAKHVTGPGPSLHSFSGIAAINGSDVWVFGGGGGAGVPVGLGTYHFDGSRWHKDPTATADMLQLASAHSSSDIWALGGFSVGTAVYHFNGRWSRVHAKALAGLTFSGVATAPRQVWVTATSATSRQWLLRLQSGHWAKLSLPWTVQLFGSYDGGLMPDGSGGIWMTGVSSGGTVQKIWLIHRSASGSWSRMAAPSVFVARFPGRTAFIATGPGGVWAHGRI